MVRFKAIGEPVNDGERTALMILRDKLPSGWIVVANFEFPSGPRHYECDALVLSPQQWAYLVEIKAWTGKIRGNDSEWALPSQVGPGETYRDNPIHLLRRKVKKLSSFLGRESPGLERLRIQPALVLINDEPPILEGRFAQYVITHHELVTRMRADPRPRGAPEPPAGASDRVLDILTAKSRPIRPNRLLGNWELLDHVGEGSHWDLWSARPRIGMPDAQFRLKRYFLDPLAIGDARERQLARARQDLDALAVLASCDGAIPLNGAPEEHEDVFVVVTDWPHGESVASIVEAGGLDQADREELVESLVSALASVHMAGVVHRGLTPQVAHVHVNGRVVLTDFDFARLRDPGVTAYLRPDDLEARYTAPEVRNDPANASKASDVWSLARIALEILGAHVDDDMTHVPPHWRDHLERALDDNPLGRPVDAAVLAASLSGAVPVSPTLEPFHLNDGLNDRFVVRSEPTSGGTAHVYKVHDEFADGDYAAKFLRPEIEGTDLIIGEVQRVRAVPGHQNLALPIWVDLLKSCRRDGKAVPTKTVAFAVSEWVEGTELKVLLTKERMAPERAVAIAKAIAEALEHLHHHDVLHRDVKPANVIVRRDGRPVLVDFNVSADLAATSDTNVGTPNYLPPDQQACGWSTATDVYALGVMLCECLAGRLLGGNKARSWLSTSASGTVHSQLVEILERAVAPTIDRRFTSARDLLQALDAVPTITADRLADTAPLPLLQTAGPNENPYIYELIRLFSQSSLTNAGTRGLDDFGRWAYVPTRVDTELKDAVISGEHRLVLITGNAGDGKTAFLQMVEDGLVRAGGTLARRSDGNGSEIGIAGRRYVTNWDGSQDEGEHDNDQVLADFFAPFAGEAPTPPPTDTRLIAINEGRLLDFLASPERRAAFPWLSRQITGFFERQVQPTYDWFVIVNLNLRALTLASEDGPSIVQLLLERFADERLWQACSSCRVRQDCYAYGNAAALRDPILGPRAGERIRRTLDLVRLRRRLHITMRDLRSVLAYVIAGNRSCAEIVELADRQDSQHLIGGQLYNAIFAASPAFAHLDTRGAARDRLLAQVGPLDVARTSDPQLDSRFWNEGLATIPKAASDHDRSDRQLIDELLASTRANRNRTTDARTVIGVLRRKYFIEREDPDWKQMLPYSRLADFERLLSAPTDNDRDELVRAVSVSDGLIDERFDGYLSVSTSGENRFGDRSFTRVPRSSLRLRVVDRSHVAHFVEYAPDVVRLASSERDDLALDVDLDLYEMLHRMLNGFVPSREELQGTWLNLAVFKAQISAIPADSLLLTRGDERYFEIERTKTGLTVGEIL